jgi:cytochrome c peroxidase
VVTQKEADVKHALIMIAIAAGIVTLLTLLNMLVPKQRVVLNDAQLRRAAQAHNLKPIPADPQAVLRLSDNPQNPLSKEKIALGKRLFFDPLLSKDKTVSCATCHNISEGGGDNLPTAIGIKGQPNPFHLNSPTVLNAALAKAQFWDGRANDVEEQAGGPVQAPFEMGMTPDEVEKRLQADASYINMFNEVFGDKTITFERVRKAIGAYERILLTRGAYDRFLEGDDNAISPAAKRGMTLFVTRGCAACHNGYAVGGLTMQKFPLRRYLSEYLGIIFSPNVKLKDSPFPFENIGGFLGQENMLRFRVPILRNITETGPYFHNGAVDKLEEAVRIMSKYQLGDEFNRTEIADVVAFLKTLKGELVVK